MNREDDEDTVSWKVRADDGREFSVLVSARDVEISVQPEEFGGMTTITLPRKKARKLFYQAWQAIDQELEKDR